MSKQQPLMKKSPLKALLWILLIPGQLILDAIFFSLGASLDSALFSNRAEDAVGHGMPVFTMLIGIVLAVVTILVIIVAIILTITRMIIISRNNKLIEQMEQRMPMNAE